MNKILFYILLFFGMIKLPDPYTEHIYAYTEYNKCHTPKKLPPGFSLNNMTFYYYGSNNDPYMPRMLHDGLI